ncbi:MAG: YfiR family protein [Planctomycetes bacterium]|nr:YfiR family protein [Planctomycetota bacterium]
MLLLVCAWLGLGAQPTRSQVTEHQTKAAMLLKFLPYVKWPERAFATPTSPLRIAVVGTDPFGKALDETFKDKKFGERPIEVVRFKGVAEVEACHVLFAPESEAPRLDKLLEKLTGKPVLLIGESKGFAANGGVINFVLKDKRVTFEINQDAAKRAEIELSSQLLQLATKVKDAKQAEGK